MRRKNVKQTGSRKETIDDERESESTPLLKSNDRADDGDGADPLQSRQGIINLVGIDADHVSYVAADQVEFVHCASKVTASLIFQTFLLGWIPLAAGLGVAFVLFPITGRLAKIYTNAQERMMKARDEQLSVVNEALMGARQIKFSALEEQWQGRILAVREKVLARVWETLRADAALFACWLIGPIASSAAALATYAVLNKGLTASVAFG